MQRHGVPVTVKDIGDAGRTAASTLRDQASITNDEAAYRLDSHILADGEYVTIRDEDSVLHAFRVVQVQQIEPSPTTVA